MDLKLRTNQIGVQAMFGGAVAIMGIISLGFTYIEFGRWLNDTSDWKNAVILALITFIVFGIAAKCFRRSEEHKKIVDFYIAEKQ